MARAIGRVPSMTVAGVVLAAGGGSRFAGSGATGPKPLALIEGRALVDYVLEAASAAGLDDLVLVDGSSDLADRDGPGVTVLHNDRWREGIATSLQVALAHARASGHGAVVVGLADQPGITADAWRAVASAPDDPPMVVATYQGHRGNPVRLAAAVWELLPTTGDEGARALMRQRPELVREVPCSGTPADIDTLEDLERWT